MRRCGGSFCRHSKGLQVAQQDSEKLSRQMEDVPAAELSDINVAWAGMARL